MDDALRAGIAVYNAGEHHAAHDAWEDHWLGLERGTDDERFLHGLIQFTAAVHHAHRRNWSGAVKLARSAGEYLAVLSPTHRGVNVGAVREFLSALATDPELVDRRRPLTLTADGDALAFGDLEFDALARAAAVLAEEHGVDEALIADATRFAREEQEAGRTRFTALLYDFAAGDERATVVERLSALVERRRSKETDVEGLFE